MFPFPRHSAAKKTGLVRVRPPPRRVRRKKGVRHHSQMALKWTLSSAQPTDPTLPLLAAQESRCQTLRWLRWGLASVPHRGDTGYSAEKAAALPPAQLCNCHQQRSPQRLSLSTSQKANCAVLCVLWTSSQDPLSPARTSSRLPVRRPPSPCLSLQTFPAWTFRAPQGPRPRGIHPTSPLPGHS